MTDTYFFWQPQVPPDTVKKNTAPATVDTTKKSVDQTVGTSAEAPKHKTDSSAAKPHAEQAATPTPVAKPAEQQHVVATPEPQHVAPQVVAETDIAAAPADTMQVLPMHPPYLYHFDNSLEDNEIRLYNIDSLLTANDSVFFHRSLFTGHSGVPASFNAKQRPDSNPPVWVFVTVVLVALLLGKVFSGYKGRKVDLLLSPFRRFSLRTLLNERAVNKASENLFVNFLYSVLLSLAGFFVIRHFGVSLTGKSWVDMLVLEAFTFVFIYARVLLVKFIGSVFNYKISTGGYILNQSICNLICGILLVPVLLLGFYSGLDATVLLYVLTIVISVMFLIRVVRGSMLMLSESQFSKIYMLYYMIVIEIVPVIVVAKWITLNV